MFRKTINIIISTVFVISTIGFSLSKHYCGDLLVDFSINSKAETCNMGGGCCHTDSEHFQLENDFIIQFSDIQFQELEIELPFLIAYSISIQKINEQTTTNIDFKEIPPPIPVPKHLSLLQTYLC